MVVKTIVMTMPRVKIPLALTIALAMMDSKATVHTAKVQHKYFSFPGCYAYTMDYLFECLFFYLSMAGFAEPSGLNDCDMNAI